MTMILAALATVTLQQADLTVPADHDGVTMEADSFKVHQSGQIDALNIVRLQGKADSLEDPTDEELAEYLEGQFRKLDQDGNRILENDELPNAVAIEGERHPAIVHDERAKSEFLKRHDQDSDLVVSFEEYLETSLNNFHNGTGILEVQQLSTFLK